MNLTQKISQMTPKGADLDATDLIEVSTIVGGSYVTKSITGQELIDAIPLPPTGLTVGTTPISSGTIGRVLFQGTGNVLQQSSSLFWDNTNAYLGIGTSAPTTGLELVGAGFKSYIKATALQAQYLINRTATATNIEFVASTHQINFNINNAEAMRLTTTRNVLINTTTDAGFKLDVNGSARALNSLVVYGDGISPATRATLTIQSLGETFSGRLVFSRNNSNWYNQIETIGSGGGVNLGLAINDSGTYSLVTNQGKVFIGNSLTIPTTSTLQVKGAGNTSATTSLLVQNNSSTELFRVRDDGNVGIGTTSPLVSLDIRTSGNSAITPLATAPNTATTLLVGNTGTNGVLALGQNNVGQTWLQGRSRLGDGSSQPILLNPLGGNILIGTTTDAGFRLDVNGTARVSGVLTAAGNYIQYGTNPSVGIGSTNNGNSFVNNGPALLYASANINSTQVYAHNFFTGTFNSTSGVQGLANLTGANFSPTSGTAVFNTINANPTINQTGGANGITRGLYVNPTLTSASDFRAIETTAGRIVFGNLPTSSAGLPTGAIWNDGGTLKIV
jgi:hypothetical protein